MLNRPQPTYSVAIPETQSKLEVNIVKPSKEEIAGVIQKQQNGRAPGQDGIPVEVLKADINNSVEILYEIFERVWEEETIPDYWKRVVS